MSRLDEIRARLATFRTWGAGTATRELHANAPDDLAWLLAEIERLTGEAAAERADVVAALRRGAGDAPKIGGLHADALMKYTIAVAMRTALLGIADGFEAGAHRRKP
jgi:hypothetical protein